ncbi:hypothetical protein A2U01_0093761, partial [Trifolium medium]|nr:hypothetical protein [Trifolium medium]
MTEPVGFSRSGKWLKQNIRKAPIGNNNNQQSQNGLNRVWD